MTEETCRTRSQKRALERDVTPNDVDSKKLKMEKGLSATDLNSEGDMKIKAEPGAGKVQGLLKGGEVKATIKVEVPTGDEPVDMSTSKSEIKREKRVPSPDVIVLSDNEPSSPRMNGLTKIALKETNTEALMKSSPEERERMIKQLKEELRILLPPPPALFPAVIPASTLIPLLSLWFFLFQPAGSSGSAVTPPPLVRGPQSVPAGKPSLQTSSTRIPGTVIPPPLVRGGQQASSKLGTQQNTQIVMPPLVRGAQQIHTIRQHSSTGPPPLLLAPRASVPSVQIQGQRIIQQGLIRVANVPNTSLLVNIPQASPTSIKGPAVSSAQANAAAPGAALGSSGESPASRQAAAKLALRKQLEKTLLEIPPPKPPAPEMNFLPSAANNEFIYLVGLEEVVQNLLETQDLPLAFRVTLPRGWRVDFPLFSDLCLRWRVDFPGFGNNWWLFPVVTCRIHILYIRAEYKNALYNRESTPSPPKPGCRIPDPVWTQGPPLTPCVPCVDPPVSPVLQSSSQMSRGAGASRGVLHSFSPSPKLQSPSASLGSRPGKHVERSGGKGGAAAWKKTPLGTGGALPFVSPSLAVHKSASAVDRQREYLLDMIPPRSIPQSATWK
ncbi:P66A protein, partial [Piprites chloris]|nr:P66A protein [Piprites chloris]